MRSQEVFRFLPDISRPSLVAFSWNLTAETITFTFDETVRATTFDTTLITLQSNVAGNDSHDLISGAVLTADSTVVVLKLGKFDLESVKLNDGLATSANTTYLLAKDGLVADMGSNGVMQYSKEITLCAANFYEDKTSPQLSSFVLDVDFGFIILNFDEPIRRSSIDFAQLTLQSQKSASGLVDSEHTLTGGTSNSPDGTSFRMNLTAVDFNEIKRKDAWARR